ncbi:MAG TPA: hypothetical protein VJS92_04340 [Candidatus Polarisedimenticolaceae bacterium]|nr:hypothetical protein [Candidatus Polarisedimenticolaceae bacterium]
MGCSLVASAFNPIAPNLILTSGLSSGFGAMAGMTLVPKLVEDRTRGLASAGGTLELDRGWIAVGSIVAIAFVAVVGRGIRF